MLLTCDCIQLRVVTGRSMLHTAQEWYAMANWRMMPGRLQTFIDQQKRQRNCAAAAYEPRTHWR